MNQVFSLFMQLSREKLSLTARLIVARWILFNRNEQLCRQSLATKGGCNLNKTRRVISELLDAKLIVEREATSFDKGRPKKIYRLNQQIFSLSNHVESQFTTRIAESLLGPKPSLFNGRLDDSERFILASFWCNSYGGCLVDVSIKSIMSFTGSSKQHLQRTLTKLKKMRYISHVTVFDLSKGYDDLPLVYMLNPYPLVKEANLKLFLFEQDFPDALNPEYWKDIYDSVFEKKCSVSTDDKTRFNAAIKLSALLSRLFIDLYNSGIESYKDFRSAVKTIESLTWSDFGSGNARYGFKSALELLKYVQEKDADWIAIQTSLLCIGTNVNALRKIGCDSVGIACVDPSTGNAFISDGVAS